MIPALLLSGGYSRRLGFNKAELKVGNEICINRVATALGLAGFNPIFEIGRGYSYLDNIVEPDIGQGPLGAIVFGFKYLNKLGYVGPIMVLSCDLPFIDYRALNFINLSSKDKSVIPVIGGTKQPLCAKWSIDDLSFGSELYANKERSLKWFPITEGVLLNDNSVWEQFGGSINFKDVDTVEDMKYISDFFTTHNTDHIQQQNLGV